ncbi:type I restriction endonuclease subunit R [Roseococcus sp. SDR]|uniref:type I restriction endonuclease subunit R n=1 Tax=Roseococcus sp. SDR TaxID=2835532 RepID=UPI00352FF144
MSISEAELEAGLLGLLWEQGIPHLPGSATAPDAPLALRAAWHEAVLRPRLLAAIARLNPHLPPLAQREAAQRITDIVFAGDLPAENRRIHEALVNGLTLEWEEGGEARAGQVQLVDWGDAGAAVNDWLAVSQFEIVGQEARRADVVLFLNGMPVVLVELKSPSAANAGLTEAFQQIETYRAQVPELFRCHAFSVISDGFTARYGSMTAGLDRFQRWPTLDGSTLPKGAAKEGLETLARGLLRPEVMLPLIRRFTVYEAARHGLIKKVASYRQFYAGLKGREQVARAAAGDGRAGVVWHTTGSGKSLLMAFLAGLCIHDPRLANPTVLVLTDRADLDEQLWSTFAQSSALLGGQAPERAETRAELRRLLSRQAGGVVFSTMQKFAPEPGEDRFPQLSDRRNIVVLVDEAHRTQYGFAARVTAKGEVVYGYAHHLRQALPHAAFVGFTGTPVSMGARDTVEVFGEVFDSYNIAAAIEDGATVPIYYEARVARLALDEASQEKLDAGYAEITEDTEESEAEAAKRRWSRMEALVGADRRLDRLAEDLLAHLDERLAGQDGKAMMVCMSRRICVDLHARIARLRPDWVTGDDATGAVKVVMTGSAADPLDFQPHIRPRRRLEELAERVRNPADPLKLVIVQSMWLTGFDAPPLHTLYIDKPMRGHTLIQAIARVNRVFGSKPGGLVVDYIGLAADLKAALSHYAEGDRQHAGLDRSEAVAAFLERLDVLRAMFHGFDISAFFTAPSGMARLAVLASAVDFVLRLEGEGEDRLAAGRRRFLDAVAGLVAAFRLSVTSAEAQAAKEEVAFFVSTRTALLKIIEAPSRQGRGAEDMDLALRQLVNGAVASTEVMDILAASGVGKTDISVLSEEFLLGLRGIERQDLAAEALRKLLNDEIAARTRTNIVQQRSFSARLVEAMTRYHNRAVDAVQVIEELIAIARALREQPEDGLSRQEAAFYDALAENESAAEVMKNEDLRVLAAELVRAVRANARVDWWKRDDARAAIRVQVKRLLRKYGYPPDLQDAAVRQVVKQAELLAAEMAR